MKKTISLILALVLALCLLTGCGQSDKDVDTSADRLRVVSATQVHTPKQNWVYSYEDGVAADGPRLSVSEMIAGTEGDTILTVPFALDPGGAIDNGVYSVYDLEGNEVYHHHMVFTEPEEAGQYLCVLEIHFGSDKVYSGYQMFWRFVVTEANVAENAK